MNKKWENPKLKQLSFENTECGAWRYLYACTNINISCDVYFFSYGSNDERSCECGGTIRIVDKHWSEGFCDGGCSS